MATDTSRVKSLAPYLATLAGAGVLYWLTFKFAGSGRPGTLGPAFWPRMAIGLMAMTAALQVVRISLGGLVQRAHGFGEDEDDDSSPHFKKLAGGLALVAFYAASITTLGYLLSSLLFVIAFMYLSGYRRHRVIWGVAGLGILAIAFIFLRIVYVSLPRGVKPFDGFTDALLMLVGAR